MHAREHDVADRPAAVLGQPFAEDAGITAQGVEERLYVIGPERSVHELTGRGVIRPSGSTETKIHRLSCSTKGRLLR